jgi:hypothetical protein
MAQAASGNYRASMRSHDAVAPHLKAMERVEDELASKIDALTLLFGGDAIKARRELRAWSVFAGLCCAGLVVIGTLAASLVR